MQDFPPDLYDQVVSLDRTSHELNDYNQLLFFCNNMPGHALFDQISNH